MCVRARTQAPLTREALGPFFHAGEGFSSFLLKLLDREPYILTYGSTSRRLFSEAERSTHRSSSQGFHQGNTMLASFVKMLVSHGKILLSLARRGYGW